MRTDLQKNGKSKFKTLDSTIITEDSNGRREDTGKRVEEINNEMAVSMGVSKAILNNVVFCHQEDSNWPLEEGQKLKVKFDEIFGTTDYNKAIDKFIKIRKGYEDKLKEQKTFKGILESAKKTAERKTTELELLKRKHESLEERSKELEAQIGEVEKKIIELETFFEKVGKLHGEKVVKEKDIETMKDNVAKLKTKIKNRFDCDIDELEDKLKSFLQTQKENVKKLDDLRAEHQKIDEQKKNVEKRTIEGTAELGVMATKLGEQQELISQRFRAIGKLCEQLGIQIDSDENSQTMDDNGLRSFFSKIESGIRDIEDKLSKTKAGAEKQDHEFQQQIDKVREEKTAAETNLGNHRQRIAKLDRDIKELRSNISSIETSMPKFNQLRDDIKNMEKKLARTKSENNPEELEDTRCGLEAEKVELDAKQRELEEDVEKLESISQIVNELTAKKNELSKAQSDFDRFKNKSASTIKHLFPAKSITSNFKDEVQSLRDSLEAEVQEIKTALEKARSDGNRIQAERDHKRKELKNKEGELKDTKDRIYRVCDGRNYMEYLTQQKEKVDKLNLELAYHKSSESIYGKYIQDIKADPCCPLCHKNFQGSEKDDMKGKRMSP